MAVYGRSCRVQATSSLASLALKSQVESLGGTTLSGDDSAHTQLIKTRTSEPGNWLDHDIDTEATNEAS